VSAAEDSAALPYARAVLLDGAMSETDLGFLYETARSMPAGAVVVEIGSFKGRSSVATCEGLTAVSGPRFVAVDPWRRSSMLDLGSYEDDDPAVDTIYQRFLRNTSPYPFVEAMRMTSLEAAPTFDDGSVDWVFIDGDHSLPAVRADIRAWWPKLRVGGLLSGHDHSWRSVRWAVASHFTDVAVADDIWHLRKEGEKLPARPHALVAGRAVTSARAVARRLLRRGV
jgi:predicted O-methyltransferase YrrM